MTPASPPEAAPGPAWILDVGDDDFEREVVERSTTTPVVVDFWAPWCAPCRALGPLLERLADEHRGAFVLAKVDVDQAPRTAAAFGVRAVPTVMGFRDGQATTSFAGAQPEGALRAFLEELLPSEADARTEAALALLRDGDLAAAEAGLGGALEMDPRHGGALLGLARLHAERDEIEEALALLDRVVPVGSLAAEKDRLAAELRTRQSGASEPDELRARLDAAPDDLALKIELGRALAARGRPEDALAELLEAVKSDPEFDDAAARRAMLDLFEVLGAEHALTRRFRPELARTLYR